MVGNRTESAWSRLPLALERAAPYVVAVLIVGNIALYGWLAVLRHQTFGTAAMDLGYTDQVVWNTLHGRWLRFTTLENAPIDLPLAEFRRTDILLAYHVELLLVPISLLYLLYSSPITLLLLQSVIVSLGAWPAYRLASAHLGSRLAGAAFALAYLLAPAVQGAILADMHGVSLVACFLLFALYFAHQKRFAPYYVMVALSLLAKEDVPLLVMGLGAYLFLFQRERRVGAITAAAGLGWFLLCVSVILPGYNGLTSSPFLPRLAIFGPTLRESFANWLADPALVVRWLARPEIVAYLRGLLASTGFLSLAAPAALAPAAPIAAMNVFSTWPWTYSEGDHYSISMVPFLVASAVFGMGWLSAQLSRRVRQPRGRVVAALCAWMLAIALWHHVQIGVSPLAKTFSPPTVTAHHRLGQALLRRIPPDAAVSAQSNLYPHLSQRERAYLYPAINDAEYVFLDVTSSPYPLTPRGLYLETQHLLRSGEFGAVAAEDGYLLLQRGAPTTTNAALPEAFYRFARASDAPRNAGVRVRFGDALELVGYDHTILNVVQTNDLPATVVTYWRVLRPPASNLRFSFFFTREDGAIAFHYGDDTSATAWYPPHRWVEGDLIRLETPVLAVGRMKDVLIAVTPPDGDPWRAEVLVGEGIELLEGDTLLRLFAFP